MRNRFRIGMMPAKQEGENALAWSLVENRFADLATQNEAFKPVAELVQKLAQSEFASAGLCIATSMHDLCLAPSRMVFQNPHLRIAFDLNAGTFALIYVDGSTKPWERQASPEHVFEIVSRFVTKRVRWYRAT